MAFLCGCGCRGTYSTTKGVFCMRCGKSARRQGVRVAEVELRFQALDVGERRQRHNGNPMPSPEFIAAMNAAVDAFRGVMNKRGFEGNTGYGATARDFEN